MISFALKARSLFEQKRTTTDKTNIHQTWFPKSFSNMDPNILNINFKIPNVYPKISNYQTCIANHFGTMFGPRRSRQLFTCIMRQFPDRIDPGIFYIHFETIFGPRRSRYSLYTLWGRFSSRVDPSNCLP